MSQSDPPPRAGLLLAGLTALAFVLRFARWERTAVLFNDGPVFLALAERSAEGAFEVLLQHPFHPLYPLTIAAVHALGAPFGLSFETAGALVSALAGSAGVLAVYALVRAAFGPREALVAAALLAIHAAALDVGGDVQSESLYLALFLGSAAALWRATSEGRPLAGLLAGALSGLAYLTRPEGIGLALVGGALIGWRALRGHLPLARAVRTGAAVALGAGLLAAPYVAALSLKSGELTLTRKKSVGWIVGTEGHKGSGGLSTGQAGMEAPKIPREELVAELGPITEPPPSAATPGAPAGAAAPDPAASDPAAPSRPDPTDSLVAPPWTARAAPAAFFDLVHDAVSAVRPEVLPLVLLGLFVLRGRPSRRGGFFGALCGAYGLLLFALAMNVGYVSERHLLPVMLLLLGYGAAGTLWLAERLAGRRGAAPSEARTRAVAAAILAIVLVVSLAKTLRHPEGIEDLAERRAAEWVREQAPGSVVAARKRRVAYYAGGPFLQLRPRTAFSFELYFTNHRVRYVVVNQVDVAEYVGLDDLIGTRLEEVHRVEEAGETALVFAVLPRPANAPAVSAAGDPR